MANSHKNELYGLARLKIIDLDPTKGGQWKKILFKNLFKINRKNIYFREVVKDIKVKVLKLKKSKSYLRHKMGKPER